MRERLLPMFARWRETVAALSGAQLFVRLGGGLVAALLLWSALCDLDIVANAGGEVIPSSQVKTVQHLEGGIVAEILVREGDRVARDQPVLALQATSSDADVQAMGVRLTALSFDILRYQAEAVRAEHMDIPPELDAAHPDKAAQARTVFKSRRDHLLSSIASQEQAVVQREQAAAEIAARLRNTRNSLRLIDEQVTISEGLMKDQLTNRYTQLTLLREQSALRSRLDEDTAAQRRAEAAVAEAKGQIDTIRLAYEQEAKENLAANRREHDELSQRLRQLSDSRDRTVIRSPVDGVVKTLYVVTEGGIIQPGSTVMDIVPADDRLIIEAKLPVYDVGHVRIGQDAKIRLASAEGARFGAIDGRVVHISPDTLVTDKGAAYYRVRIETVADRFQAGTQTYVLYPGVQVEAAIITGARSVLAYLTDPFIGYAGTALQER